MDVPGRALRSRSEPVEAAVVMPLSDGDLPTLDSVDECRTSVTTGRPTRRAVLIAAGTAGVQLATAGMVAAGGHSPDADPAKTVLGTTPATLDIAPGSGTALARGVGKSGRDPTT